jgi:hypothetical protein
MPHHRVELTEEPIRESFLSTLKQGRRFLFSVYAIPARPGTESSFEVITAGPMGTLAACGVAAVHLSHAPIDGTPPETLAAIEQLAGEVGPSLGSRVGIDVLDVDEEIPPQAPLECPEEQKEVTALAFSVRKHMPILARHLTGSDVEPMQGWFMVDQAAQILYRLMLRKHTSQHALISQARALNQEIAVHEVPLPEDAIRTNVPELHLQNEGPPLLEVRRANPTVDGRAGKGFGILARSAEDVGLGLAMVCECVKTIDDFSPDVQQAAAALATALTGKTKPYSVATFKIQGDT